MILIFLIGLAVLLFDQLTKLAVVGFFVDYSNPLFVGMLAEKGDSVEIIPDIFSFTYVLNEGAAFGILKNQRWFFLISTVVICIVGVIVLLRLKKKHWTLSVSAGFVLGGALGNMIDRVVVGVVRDFLDATFCETWFGFSFPVFNVADIFVVVGVALMAFYILFIHDKIYPEKIEKSEKNDAH